MAEKDGFEPGGGPNEISKLPIVSGISSLQSPRNPEFGSDDRIDAEACGGALLVHLIRARWYSNPDEVFPYAPCNGPASDLLSWRWSGGELRSTRSSATALEEYAAS